MVRRFQAGLLFLLPLLLQSSLLLLLLLLLLLPLQHSGLCCPGVTTSARPLQCHKLGLHLSCDPILNFSQMLKKYDID